MRDESIFDQIPEVISRLGPRYELVAQNRHSLERFGPSVGEPCYRAHFGRDDPCPGCLLKEVLQSGSARRWFLTNERGGDTSYFEITAAPLLDDEGNVAEIIEIIRDHTMTVAVEQSLIRGSEKLEEEVERSSHELEDLAARTEKLRGELAELRGEQAALVQTEKMASIGRLAAGLTHEIHTPMGALVSNLDMQRRCLAALRAAAAGTDDFGLKQQAETWEELLELQGLATERIRRIVHSLRTFAHIDRAERERYDVHEGIEAALALLTHETRGRIEVECDFHELPPVLCRPDALNQVFMNLLENAVKAIEGEGVVRVETRRLDGDRISLRFIDTGHGIPADKLEKIFEPGFTTKPRGVGTGLGLAIASKTIRDHGGEIQVRSEPGKGSEFTLILPLDGGNG